MLSHVVKPARPRHGIRIPDIGLVVLFFHLRHGENSAVTTRINETVVNRSPRFGSGQLGGKQEWEIPSCVFADRPNRIRHGVIKTLIVA